MTPNIQTILAAMVERIVAGFKPERIILFGSNARGTAGADSDVDLIIVMPTIESKRKIRLAIREAVNGMGLSKDILVYTPEEMERYRHLTGSLVRSAWREGKVLYERVA